MDQSIGPTIRDGGNSTLLPQSASNGNHSNASPDYLLRIAMMAEIYCVPVICSFGLTGNTLSAITFFTKPLRNTSCSVYLAVRSLSDNGFLLAILLIWLSGVFDLRLSRVTGVCQTIVFLTYVCGCVSVWMVVFVTTETYVRICHPFVAKSFCARRPAKIVTLFLCIFSFGVYNIPIWISNSDCSHNLKYFELTQVLVYADTVLTLVIPSFLITCLMSAIVYQLIRIYQRHRRRSQSSASKTRLNGEAPPAAKVTKMLFIVSLMYFILNIPSHVIRLEILINNFIKGRVQLSSTERLLQTLFQLLYYFSLAINIIIYLKFGRNFRNTFKDMFCRQLLSGNKQSSHEAVNMVHRSDKQRIRSMTVISGTKQTEYLILSTAV